MSNDPISNPGGDGERIDVSSASQGQKTGHIRWVLGIGTVLVIVGFIAAYALTS
jgi:hypothetical protein